MSLDLGHHEGRVGWDRGLGAYPLPECLGQSTCKEAEAARDEAGQQAAVDLDSEDEVIGGGAAMPNALEGISLSFSDLSQDTSQ